MTVATHPTSETLAAFARGDLPSAELAMVADHIGACAACCAILSGVPDDTLAGLAREAGAASDKSKLFAGLKPDDINGMLDMMPELNDAMPAYTGTVAERAALIAYMENLGKQAKR